MPDQCNVAADVAPPPHNPFYPFALTEGDVELEGGFLVYNVQDGLQPSDEFSTEPFMSLSGWLAVNTKNFPTTPMSLAEFGIVPYRVDPRWNYRNVTVANTPEGRRQLKEWLEPQDNWMAEEAIRTLSNMYPND
jgi:hypothetical protein